MVHQVCRYRIAFKEMKRDRGADMVKLASGTRQQLHVRGFGSGNALIIACEATMKLNWTRLRFLHFPN